jgi:FdhD protein
VPINYPKLFVLRLFNEISMKNLFNNYILGPLPETPSLTASVVGQDQEGSKITTSVVIERPLTIFLNSQEIVTVMTVGDYPDMLAVGFLLNQNMLRVDDEIISIDFDDDLDVVIVRTKRETNFEQQLKKKTLTSGCAQGTVFGDLMEKFEKISIGSSAILKTTWLYALSQKINSTPSLYLKVGAIHGCVLCKEDQPLIYMEDVGRHNAIDKIAGYMFLNKISAKDKIFYTTGRLTSEMVIKTVQMGIPILISRSGFTAWGVELAKEAGLTLIGRAKGRRFTALSGLDRIIYDADLKKIDDEPENVKRKSANEANGR